MPPRRRWTFALRRGPATLTIALATYAGHARADATSDNGAAGCIEAFEEAQTYTKGSKLTSARAAFARCLDHACPAALRQECSTRYDAVDARTPSIVFSVRSAKGGDVADVALELDAGVTTAPGLAVELDPGPHHVRVLDRAGRELGSFDVIARDNEKLRHVVHELEPKNETDRPESPPATAKRPSYLPTYAAAGVAIVGYASFAFFGLRGASDYDDLDARCAPRCPESDARRVRDNFLLADISLGVGVAATAAAALLFWLASRESTPAAAPPRLVVKF